MQTIQVSKTILQNLIVAVKLSRPRTFLYTPVWPGFLVPGNSTEYFAGGWFILFSSKVSLVDPRNIFGRSNHQENSDWVIIYPLEKFTIVGCQN